LSKYWGSYEAEFLRLIEAQNPVASSWETPIYSNEAFQLLAMAFENITGEAISDAFESGLMEPLNLKRSFWKPPSNDSNAVVVNPPGAHRFDEDLGEFAS
jgi:CubicO group peptidase (beta-lactamase class C family)